MRVSAKNLRNKNKCYEFKDQNVCAIKTPENEIIISDLDNKDILFKRQWKTKDNKSNLGKSIYQYEKIKNRKKKYQIEKLDELIYLKENNLGKLKQQNMNIDRIDGNVYDCRSKNLINNNEMKIGGFDNNIENRFIYYYTVSRGKGYHVMISGVEYGKFRSLDIARKVRDAGEIELFGYNLFSYSNPSDNVYNNICSILNEVSEPIEFNTDRR